MTHQEAIKWQYRLFPMGNHLPDICLELRAAINGSADPWPDSRIREVRDMLKARLDTWYNRVFSSDMSLPLDGCLDEVVRLMVATTVSLVTIYLERKG